MKKIIGLVLVFILVFSVVSGAFAGSRPKITKQPETATIKKGGTVSFSIKTSGTVKTIIWYFVDPASGSTYTGKQLSGAVKGVKVQNPNSKKITLSKVPEALHGWTVYAHVNGNGYKIDSDKVQLLIAGMDTPAEEPKAETPPAENPPADEPVPQELAADVTPAVTETPAEPAPAPAAAPAQDQQSGPFRVTATSKVLKRLDDSGNVIDDTLVSTLEFEDYGYVLVTSEDPIVSWTLNGIRVHPDQPVREFMITNITSDLVIDVKVQRTAAADVVVDETRLCKVTCTGCTFTYIRGRLISVTEGEVPAGAPVNVSANTADLARGGYRINGGEPENAGKAGFQLIVNGDVEIICE